MQQALSHDVKISAGADWGGFPVATKTIYLKSFETLAVLALMDDADFALQNHEFTLKTRQGGESSLVNFYLSRAYS